MTQRSRVSFSVSQMAGRGWLGKAFLSAVAPGVDRLLNLEQIEKTYGRVVTREGTPPTGTEFVRLLLEELNVRIECASDSFARIPKSGPLVVVANHPFGGIEAAVLLLLLRRIRADVKFLANHLLGKFDESKEVCIYVDPFGGASATAQNLKPIREGVQWVRSGGVLCVFPSGTVSHYQRSANEITDPEWSPTVGRIVRLSGAPVLPVFFPGRNSLLFQTAGLIHPALRTALLVREFYNKRNRCVRAKFGNVVPIQKLRTFETDKALITYLRVRTYILENENGGPAGVFPSQASSSHSRRITRRTLPDISPPVPPDVLEDEIMRLPRSQLLIDSHDGAVYVARAKQIPNVLQEIGRLREATFRAVNEGSGTSCDVDRFDSYYTHLFAWNGSAKQVIGAYRLAKTDRVVRRKGLQGLYSHTLFEYKPALLAQLGPALELGRSFVQPEYQRNYMSLLLLWRGIGEYISRNPRYRMLIGPVSINNEYDSISRGLITMFLKANNFRPDLARLIKARNPLARTKVRGLDQSTTSLVVRDLADVSDLLKDIEAQHSAIPILLRQYVKLGGKFLAFNLDPSFGDVLDGLICVDLVESDRKLLDRYFTPEGAARFLEYHGALAHRAA